MLNLIIGFIITFVFAVGGAALSKLIHEENERKEIVNYDYKI